MTTPLGWFALCETSHNINRNCRTASIFCGLCKGTYSHFLCFLENWTVMPGCCVLESSCRQSLVLVREVLQGVFWWIIVCGCVCVFFSWWFVWLWINMKQSKWTEDIANLFTLDKTEVVWGVRIRKTKKVQSGCHSFSRLIRKENGDLKDCCWLWRWHYIFFLCKILDSFFLFFTAVC